MKTEQEYEDMKIVNTQDLILEYNERTIKAMLQGKLLFTIMFGCGEWLNAKDDITIDFNAAKSPEWDLVEAHQIQGNIHFRITKKAQAS